MAKHDPQHTPQPAMRLTTPLEPGSTPLSEFAEMHVRIQCWRCHGNRTVDDTGYVRCDVCGKAFDGDKLTAWGLPCGHAPRAGESIALRYHPCPTCGGEGYLYRWLPFGVFLDWVDEEYASISQAVTARRKAL